MRPLKLRRFGLNPSFFNALERLWPVLIHTEKDMAERTGRPAAFFLLNGRRSECDAGAATGQAILARILLPLS
jgi:hypothetical protein